MRRTVSWTVVGVVMLAGTAGAQTPRGATAQQTALLEQAMRLKESRYQIGQIERLLEGAVEHGATVIRDRLLAIMPADMLLTENARARGFRLDGYGVFFDVEVPSLNGTLTWTLLTLDKAAPAPAPGSAPVQASTVAPILPNARRAAGDAPRTPDRPLAAASAAPKAGQNNAPINAAPSDDRILENPNEEYRGEVVQALADAMLDYSGPLAVGDQEWLTIAARGIQDRPRVGPPDSDAQTVMIRVRGADLTAFRAGQLSRDDLMRRIEKEKRVF